jgi:methyltransferase family protein
MLGVEGRIESLDVSLFSAIHSESTTGDRQSLLKLARCVRGNGEYSYLEIGSYMGGSLQPFYADPLCKRMYSIDKRPEFMPDERGRLISYPKSENSANTMLSNLKRAFPLSDATRVVTFEADASDVDTSRINPSPQLCFIDGEHTDVAVFRDFRFCLKVVAADGIIAMHDADLVFKGIQLAETKLAGDGARFQSFILPDRVFVILLNGAIEAYSVALRADALDREQYFARVERNLGKERAANQASWVNRTRDWLANYPWAYRMLRSGKGLVTGLVKRS